MLSGGALQGRHLLVHLVRVPLAHVEGLENARSVRLNEGQRRSVCRQPNSVTPEMSSFVLLTECAFQIDPEPTDSGFQRRTQK